MTLGATPVFADIDADTYNVDPADVQRLVSPRCAAIMAVHLYGNPAAMDPLREIARVHGLILVEDSAQAHGAALGGAPVGALGDIACFSFYPTKNMHSLEGGMIVTPDAAVARTARILRNQGMSEKYRHEMVGPNMRLTDVAAAVGRVQLGKLAASNERRRMHAELLTSGLRGVKAPITTPGGVHVFNQYTVRTERRDHLQVRLAEQGIETSVYYRTPVHRQPAYVSSVHEAAALLPRTERASRELLSLPVNPSLGQSELIRVIDAVNRVSAES